MSSPANRSQMKLQAIMLAAALTASVNAHALLQAPDNSATNKQQTVTADKQSSSSNDRETARKIRKSVIADKSLSLYAHNVKIIVVDGQVTLKGPVKSDDEKKKIGDIATQVAGSSEKVTNDISVKSGS